jgi:hypothetical protein
MIASGQNTTTYTYVAVYGDVLNGLSITIS